MTIKSLFHCRVLSSIDRLGLTDSSPQSRSRSHRATRASTLPMRALSPFGSARAYCTDLSFGKRRRRRGRLVWTGQMEKDGSRRALISDTLLPTRRCRVFRNLDLRVVKPKVNEQFPNNLLTEG